MCWSFFQRFDQVDNRIHKNVCEDLIQTKKDKYIRQFDDNNGAYASNSGANALGGVWGALPPSDGEILI